MIGTKIRKLRKEKRLTQATLADGIMHRCVLIRIEKELAEPSIEQLHKIAKKLGVSSEYFTLTDPQMELDFQHNSIETCDLVEMFQKKDYNLVILAYTESNKTKFKKQYGLLYSYLVGISYWNMQDYRLASKFLMVFINRINRLEPSLKKKYTIEFAESLNVIARINFFDKKTDEVEMYLVQARNSLIDNNRKSHILYWSISHNLANYYEEIMEYEKALAVLLDVINEENVILHKSTTPAAHQTASVIYIMLGDFSSAKKHLIKAIHLYNYADNIHQANLCKVNLIIIMRMKKEYDEAFEFIEITLKESSPSDQIYHIFLLQKAFVMFNSGDINGISHILKHLNYAKLRTKDRYNFLFLKGISYYFLAKDFYKAEICFKKAKPFFEENKLCLDIIYMNNLLCLMPGEDTYVQENKLLFNTPYNTNFVLDIDELATRIEA